ncbi:hypothetical protein L9F63_009487, partial [Diploptera punctata]
QHPYYLKSCFSENLTNLSENKARTQKSPPTSRTIPNFHSLTQFLQRSQIFEGVLPRLQ